MLSETPLKAPDLLKPYRGEDTALLRPSMYEERERHGKLCRLHIYAGIGGLRRRGQRS
jgi:hypothetical protein